MKAGFTPRWRDNQTDRSVTVTCIAGQPPDQRGSVGLTIGQDHGSRFAYLDASEARELAHLLMAASQVSDRLQAGAQ
jgi:hypothetical protein